MWYVIIFHSRRLGVQFFGLRPYFPPKEASMAKRCVIGILVTNRVENAPEVQKVLTECGCYIKTRIGLHEVTENLCAPGGLILLELFGTDTAYAEVEAKLKGIRGLQVQKMVFES
jgi:hypothetical protein